MKYYITPEGLYYAGDRQSGLDLEVAQKPGEFYIYKNGAWVEDRERKIKAQLENMERLTGLSRALRELIIEGKGNGYLYEKALEIEDLSKTIRRDEE